MATTSVAARRAGWAFVAPAVTLMILILLLPIAGAALLSFTDYSLGGAAPGWVGLENYEKILTQSRYRAMFEATLTYVLTVTPLSIGLGLGAALLIHSLRWGGAFYKTVFFLPAMATLMAMSIVWSFTLHPTLGLVNATLGSFCGTGWLHLWGWFDKGCRTGFPLWLGDGSYAIWTVCFVGVWQGFGFNMVLYLAGLTSVPRELYQAAEMDGARTAWDRFRLVTWPMLGPTTVFVVTITVIRSFQVFDIVEGFYEQGAGPSRSAYVILFAMYEKGIRENLIGIGAAIAMIFLAFVVLTTLIQQRILDKKAHYA